LNSPFSQEQIVDSCNATRAAVHLGQNLALFLVAFVIGCSAMLVAFLYKTEFQHWLIGLLKDDRRMLLAFTVIFIVGNTLFIPLGIFSFFSGFVFTWKWGFFKGAPFCIFCNFFFWQVSQLVSFLLGRYMFPEFI
jgi:hypothetical protein